MRGWRRTLGVGILAGGLALVLVTAATLTEDTTYQSVVDQLATLNELMSDALDELNTRGLDMEKMGHVVADYKTAFEGLLASMPDLFNVPMADWFDALHTIQNAYVSLEYMWRINDINSDKFAAAFSEAKAAKDKLEGKLTDTSAE